MHHRTWIACMATVAAACGSDAKDVATDAAPASPAPVSQEQYRLAQERRADSVLSDRKSSAELARELGGGYMVAPARLHDSLATLANGTRCFLDGRRTDPYLAGSVAFLVSMGEAGSNQVQVQESVTRWTSAAGNIVNSCLNVAAKDWQFDARFGKAGSYVTQVQFK